MLIINENFNFLTKKEEFFLKKLCENFILEERPNKSESYTNNYERRCFGDNTKTSQSIYNKLLQYVNNVFKKNNIDTFKFKIHGKICINKISSSTNKNDGFHHDHSDATLILYLNDEFTGGEYEYLNDDKIKVQIKPKKNLVLLTNRKIHHRVLPVITGERFSLVCFLTKEEKNINSII